MRCSIDNRALILWRLNISLSREESKESRTHTPHHAPHDPPFPNTESAPIAAHPPLPCGDSSDSSGCGMRFAARRAAARSAFLALLEPGPGDDVDGALCKGTALTASKESRSKSSKSMEESPQRPISDLARTRRAVGLPRGPRTTAYRITTGAAADGDQGEGEDGDDGGTESAPGCGGAGSDASSEVDDDDNDDDNDDDDEWLWLWLRLWLFRCCCCWWS